MRALATTITANCVRVDVSGPLAIAKWVRRHIRYRQETPGVEILQGPYTTLKTKVGDCDDVTILWVALCRSIGLDAAFAGVQQANTHDYVHAMGYMPEERTFYELTDDRAYAGAWLPYMTARLPGELRAVYWDSSTGNLLPAVGGGSLTSRRAVRTMDQPEFVWVAIAAAALLIAWSR